MSEFEKSEVERFVKDGLIPSEALALGQAIYEYFNSDVRNDLFTLHVTVEQGHDGAEATMEVTTPPRIGLNGAVTLKLGMYGEWFVVDFNPHYIRVIDEPPPPPRSTMYDCGKQCDETCEYEPCKHRQGT